MVGHQSLSWACLHPRGWLVHRDRGPPCPAQLQPKQEQHSSPRASGTADLLRDSHMPTVPLWRTAVARIPVRMTCSRAKGVLLSRVAARQGVMALGCGVTRVVSLSFRRHCLKEDSLQCVPPSNASRSDEGSPCAPTKFPSKAMALTLSSQYAAGKSTQAAQVRLQQFFNESKEGNEVTSRGGPQCRKEQE